MKNFVKKLREKPEEERKHILHISTFVCAILLIAFWSFTLKQDFSDPDLQVRVQQEVKPFKDLQANVLDSYDG